jgi:dehydrogenase/reductase SDR family protein 12
MLNKVYDFSPYHSFDSRGFQRHEKEFSPLKNISSEKFGLVTGGTSGIGLGVSQFLKNQNISFGVTGRDATKASELIDERRKFFQLDLSDWDEIKKLAHTIDRPLDFLVLNAGGMPDKYLKNKWGYEYQCASQLVGHYLLFRYFHELGKISPAAKILWISSGGMYLKKLDLKNLFAPRMYDKVACYANVKRAQVILSELLSEKYHQYFFASMHPGWVKTEAVKVALPTFYQLTEKNLRTIREGSDTINFLLTEDHLPTGKFWFDREQKNPNPWLLAWTKSDSLEKKSLLKKLEEIYSTLNQESPNP